MISWAEAVYRGMAWGVKGGITNATANHIVIQLFNPTRIQDPKPVNAYIHSVLFWCNVQTFARLLFFNTQIGGSVQGDFGHNLADPQYLAITSQSQLFINTVETNLGPPIYFYPEILIPANTTVQLTEEWLRKLPAGDTQRAGLNNGTGLIAYFDPVAAGSLIGASFSWVEVTP